MDSRNFFNFVLLASLGGLTLLESPVFAAKAETIESYLQSISSVPDVLSRRDPFEQPPPPFQVRAAPAETGIDPGAPVLQRFPIQEYVVVAVLLGDVYPRALIRPPSGTKSVLIVKEKDRLGNHGGIISKINQSGIVVTQKKRDESGFVEKADFVLSVGAASKAVEAVPTASGGTKSGT